MVGEATAETFRSFNHRLTQIYADLSRGIGEGAETLRRGEEITNHTADIITGWFSSVCVNLCSLWGCLIQQKQDAGLSL